MVEPDMPVLSDLATSNSDQPENLLGQLAEKRRVISETRETHIPVPGYDKEPPLLLARHRLLDGPEIERIGGRITREHKSRWERQINAAVEMIIISCTGMFVDVAGDGEIQPLTFHGEPITGFTRDLAEALQFDDKIEDADRARDVVFGLFANNDAAIAQHNYVLNRWFTDTSVDVTQEFFTGNL